MDGCYIDNIMRYILKYNTSLLTSLSWGSKFCNVPHDYDDDVDVDVGEEEEEEDDDDDVKMVSTK